LKRSVANAHLKDIICGDFAMNLDLIATGGRDNVARIWDYEKIIPIDEFKGDDSEGG
jgi:WD40 repeat protein